MLVSIIPVEANKWTWRIRNQESNRAMSVHNVGCLILLNHLVFGTRVRKREKTISRIHVGAPMTVSLGLTWMFLQTLQWKQDIWPIWKTGYKPTRWSKGEKSWNRKVGKGPRLCEQFSTYLETAIGLYSVMKWNYVIAKRGKLAILPCVQRKLSSCTASWKSSNDEEIEKEEDENMIWQETCDEAE